MLVRSCTIAVAATLSAALLAACAGGSAPTVPIGQAPAQRDIVAVQTIYAYSPGVKAGLVASYPSSANGNVSPSATLSGAKTGLAGGKGYYFGGGVEVGSDGTLYVLDGMEGVLRTYAPGTGGSVAHGNVAPERIEILPPNSARQAHVPMYAGLAQDTKGNFWTVDRSDAKLVEFPLDKQGKVQPLQTLVPLFSAAHGLTTGNAAGVADDGAGNIYCSCQSHELLLQLYGITVYDVTGAHPKFVRTNYGILGDLDTQIPSPVIHVDAHTKQVYIGLYKPAAVVSYPIDAKGQVPPPRVIGGTKTTLDTSVEAIATDANGEVYAAINTTIAVFGAHDSGNVKPIRILKDPKHLQYVDYSFGNMLVVR